MMFCKLSELKEVDDLLNGKTGEEKLNVLYSAVVSNKSKLVNNLLNKTEEVGTGKTIVDDWGDVQPVKETKSVFKTEDIKKVYDATQNLTNKKEGVGIAKKEIIKKAATELAKK